MTVPKHLAIIMDGNRRFAKEMELLDKEGHKHGAEKIKPVLNWCRELGIKEVTLWAFSSENFNRPKEELDELFRLFKEYAIQFANDSETHENKIKVNIIGDISRFPKDVKEAILEAVDKTKNYDSFILNIALGYGGKQEIVDCIQNIAKLIEKVKLSSKDIDKELIETYMYSRNMSNIDLVIRTSGEQRTSGFLMWKTDYAEYYFCDKYWPEFSKEDLLKAIISYSERKRRFGK